MLTLTGFGYGFEEAVVLAFASHTIQFALTVPLSLIILMTLTGQPIGIDNHISHPGAWWRTASHR